MDGCRHRRPIAARPDGVLADIRLRRPGLPILTGFTVLELLVVAGIMSALAAIVIPAIGAAREAAHRLQCSSQLRQVGLALHCYHDAFHCLPAGWQWEATQYTAYGWANPLLPYLEEQATYALIDRNVSIAAAANAAVRERRVPLLVCPSDVAGGQFDLYAETAHGGPEEHGAPGDELLVVLPSANYVAVFGTSEPDDAFPTPPGEGAFIDSRPIRLAELTRGTSNTLLVGERTAARLPSTWLAVDRRGEDAVCRLTGTAFAGPNCGHCDECEFSSRHAGGVNFLFGDGHVTLVADSIEAPTYRRLARRMNDD